MRKPKNDTGLRAYLAGNGIASDDKSQEAQEIKKAYWREYRRKWKQAKDQSEHPHTVYFKGKEYRSIKEAARHHKLSDNAMIKKAALAYCNQTFIYPDQTLVTGLRQDISLLISKINSMEDECTIPEQMGERLTKRLQELEQIILQKLNDAINVEQWIMTACQNNPLIKERFKELLL